MKELLTRKESKRWPGLFVKKYTHRVFFDNLWHENDELMEARGHVELEDGTTVIRPFTKIFNRFENNTDIDRNEACVFVQKVNGFMAAATWVPEVADVVISTTGSLDSDFVGYAEEYLCDAEGYIKSMMQLEKRTYLFEIVHPDDPHIIPEEAGAYLIGYRDLNVDAPYFSDPEKEAELDLIAKAMRVRRPHWEINRFSDIVEEARTCKHEGFVVYGQLTGTVLKIKSPYYLVLKMAARRKDIMKLNKQHVDEEFYPLIDQLTLMGESFTIMSEQERLDYMRKFLEF